MGLKTIGGRNIDMADTTYVNEKVKGKLSNAGSIFFKDLPALAEELVGNVYNIKDDFVTTDDFVEGEGVTYYAGSDIAIINLGGELAYDVIGGNEDHDYASDEEVNDVLGGLYKD